MKGILGRKIGMTSVFTKDGRLIPVTAIEVEPNVYEAIKGQSTADFISKLSISLKESSETEYWLELLHESEYIEDKSFDSIYNDCKEILKILISITKSQKNSLFNQ